MLALVKASCGFNFNACEYCASASEQLSGKAASTCTDHAQRFQVLAGILLAQMYAWACGVGRSGARGNLEEISQVEVRVEEGGV